ncbi:MAG: DNA-directed RNA polymerase subunit beta' [Planctomycetota bacterium]|nr:DNA-directed RNA polymerase subunit beta' [Planctomycetota bacterium]
MADLKYDKINDYTSVSISLASPNDIRSWSYGEVKKPETINYRTYRPEKDGLFCERIFGPERDWECACGKYKGIKHKGIICDRCGVKVTHSRERRKRMGHINLAAPIVHIWFFKSLPSRLGTLLGMKTGDLERVIYFQQYVVTEQGDSPLGEKELMSEEQYRMAREEYGDSFEAGMGAEAVRKLLLQLDLEALSGELRQELKETGSKQRAKDIIKQLKTVEAVRDSINRPEWMILEVIPVIPPDLRPLVLLESGNFATSDLNDLYRRVINRNNRLKKLLELHAPEVIIRNEKRMLQQAVDSLFDNERCKRPVLGSSNRPLKSLTDMIKGKQGRFRENLLGKRVDYSGRSVIVVGPELKLHQCGLPKKIALELFQPFIIRRLKELGLADTIKSGKKMLERKDERVWDILDEVIHEHPVLLNRAPTLHRMGIQAFEPVLIEGNAIRIHPLVCEAYNADFDGDQMAVHLPLSIEAQTEAFILMLSTNNIFSPADGSPIISATLDIVLGLAYLTVNMENLKGQGMTFATHDEAMLAFDEGKVHLHATVRVRIPAGRHVKDVDLKIVERKGDLVQTTVGRILFNDILSDGMPYYNFELDKKNIGRIVAECHALLSRRATIALLDALKDTGFKWATLAGISFSTHDLKAPPKKKQIIEKTQLAVDKIEGNYRSGVITEGERYNQILDHWTHATEEVAADLMEELKNDTRDGVRYLNPIYLMTSSGARGNVAQIRQLAGMRGLMAKPSGKIIETPIKANFREGLPVLEYFSSTHGGRKGLADTALKTAESGYLTRKLADVAQNIVVSMYDCGTVNGITKAAVYSGEEVEVPLADAILGRIARDSISHPVTDEVIVRENEIITPLIATKLEDCKINKIRVRSLMTCEAGDGICALCYGVDLSNGNLAEQGLGVGIIAAQSIGEPGTQLTMRTFHIGGIARHGVAESEVKAENPGVIELHGLEVVVNSEGKKVVLNRRGEIILNDKKGRELRRYQLQLGAYVLVDDGEEVKKGKLLAQWDPHLIPVLTEKTGRVRFEDIIEDVTMREEVDAAGTRRKVIVEHKGDLHPQIIIDDENGQPISFYPIPEKSHLDVEDGEEVSAGALLAKTPREVSRTQDITGGLPRVTELFEARKPKDPAVISEIDGICNIAAERKRGKRNITVTNEATNEEFEHLIPQGKHLAVHSGDRVQAGDRLCEGPLVPHDILRIKGEEAVQQYLLDEVQSVYRSQNEKIDDKHMEAIISAMIRRVRVGQDVGDSDLLPGSIVDRFLFKQENERVLKLGGRPASASPLLLGITKAALNSESFISAASFQETTKVLTEASLSGKKDTLRGLKENVILGHMIPAGTGFKSMLETEIQVRIPKADQERELAAAGAETA